MDFHLWRETPEGSGTFSPVAGEILGEIEAALRRAVELAAEGARVVIHPYESMRQPATEPVEPAAPASTQE